MTEHCIVGVLDKKKDDSKNNRENRQWAERELVKFFYLNDPLSFLLGLLSRRLQTSVLAKEKKS